ncbi:MAG: SPOR domain-containing protein [Longimicrobiales bacterium]
MNRLAFCLLCASTAALPAAAQQQRLERADSLLVAGQYELARTALADWEKANPRDAGVEPAVRAHALYLRGRLTTKATDAREQYLALVLSYPTAREAPDALLRLGQGFLAADQPARAVVYLERLVSDYPTAGNRPQALLWLTRAQIAAGNASIACSTAGEALKSGVSDADVHALLQEEEKTACSAPPPKPVPAPRPTPPAPDSDTRARPDTGREPAARSNSTTRSSTTSSTRRATSTGRFALQTGAFREVSSANTIAASLRRKGFDARVAYVSGSPLARVRVGRFSSSEAAASEARRLKSAGVNAIIVDDAARERSER